MADNQAPLQDSGFQCGKNVSRLFIDALANAASVAFPPLITSTFNRFLCITYFVHNCFMKSVKWSPYLDLTIESRIISVWFSFPNLRPHIFLPVFYMDCALYLVGLCTLTMQPLWIGSDSLGYVQSAMMEDLPSFCDRYKALGHDKKECGILNPHFRLPKMGSTTINNVRSDGNVNGVLETIDNVVVPNLTLVSLVNALVVNVRNGIEASYDMDKVTGELDIEDKVGIAEERTSPSNTVLHLSIACINREDVNDSLGTNNYGLNLIATPIASPGDGVDGDSTIAHSGVNSIPFGMEHGEDLVVPVNDVFPVPSSKADSLPINEKTFIDVLISIISNDALKAQLSLNMKHTCLDQTDWLVGSSSVPYGGVENDLGESADEFHAMYSLNVNCIVEKVFSRGGGKCGRRKCKIK
ncbi:hypothetical protein IEQ34_004972 [Dendrobium chrysotoxum]|uniref:DUF4283 domain-containing protein n=1 Tax=Dendrobium chrysotoxum TaxID=161865 RepID=A0AAV7HB07_DENCH|nr:hypothetical protein IEQ34_004972 [Dendrobium chrysotoxum]